MDFLVIYMIYSKRLTQGTCVDYNGLYLLLL